MQYLSEHYDVLFCGNTIIQLGILTDISITFVIHERKPESIKQEL